MLYNVGLSPFLPHVLVKAESPEQAIKKLEDFLYYAPLRRLANRPKNRKELKWEAKRKLKC